MKVIGFNFTKISGERNTDITNSSINFGIKFTNLEKEKVEILKDSEALKISFHHTITYEAKNEKDLTPGLLSFEGNIVLSLSKDQTKDVMKNWETKNLPQDMTLKLSNLILKRCTPRIVQLQEELALPSHMQVPRLGKQNPN